MKSGRRAVLAALATGVIAAGGVATMATAASAAPFPAGCQVGLTNVQLTHLNGTSETIPHMLGSTQLKPGDTVKVNFTVPQSCTTGVQLSFASYRAPTSSSNAIDQQILFESATGTFRPGPGSLTVHAFGAPAGNPADCSVSHNSNTGNGANTSGPYNSTCNGSASLNGNGNGNANGRPCAGCVGNADDKNPPGQMPNGNDPNAGYECDRNHGVGRTNPAHTGCQNAQLDFVYGGVLQTLSPTSLYGDRKIDYANF